MRSNRHRCPLALMPQIGAPRILSLLPVFCMNRLTSKCNINFSGLLSVIVLSCLFFFPHSWPSFVFSESIYVSWIWCVFPSLLFFFWVIPWLPFSWPMFCQTIQNIPYLYISISTTESKIESLPRLHLQNPLHYNRIFHFSVCYSHSRILRKERNGKSLLNEFC